MTYFSSILLLVSHFGTLSHIILCSSLQRLCIKIRCSCRILWATTKPSLGMDCIMEMNSSSTKLASLPCLIAQDVVIPWACVALTAISSYPCGLRRYCLYPRQSSFSSYNPQAISTIRLQEWSVVLLSFQSCVSTSTTTYLILAGRVVLGEITSQQLSCNHRRTFLATSLSTNGQILSLHFHFDKSTIWTQHNSIQ